MGTVTEHCDVSIEVKLRAVEKPNAQALIDGKFVMELGLGEMQAADKAVEEIRRHVGGVYARAYCHTSTVCEFCKSIWETEFDGPEGPGCCGKAHDEWAFGPAKKGADNG